jgi:hypothetical protein
VSYLGLIYHRDYDSRYLVKIVNNIDESIIKGTSKNRPKLCNALISEKLQKPVPFLLQINSEIKYLATFYLKALKLLFNYNYTINYNKK